jgi:hypothetical protein
VTRWWRAYDEAANDPKLQLLPGELFKKWFNCMCIASAHDGRLPKLPQLAFLLRIKERDAALVLASLMHAGLIDKDSEGYSPHNWNVRQYKSDDVTSRVRKHREKQRQGVPRNGGETFHGTPPDTDTDTEDNKSKNLPSKTPREPDTPRPFPEDGSIAFSAPFAEIARRQGRGADPDVLASAFRRFCREREIDFASPQIAVKFETFCGKHRIRGLHA